MLPRRPTGHGGWRPGAGRKRGVDTSSHQARPRFRSSEPQHVVLRTVADAPSLRRAATMRVVRAAIVAGGHQTDFRVVHFNVLGDRLHLVVEAASADALTRRMQGLASRLARRINALLGRRGSLFARRYDARTLRTPREVRDVIRYVLLAGRDQGGAVGPGWVDPCSSALWFDGWKAALQTDTRALRALLQEASPTAAPHTRLLATDWRHDGGLIDIDDAPGPPPPLRSD